MTIRTARKTVLFLLTFALLAACQPSPEERMQQAQQYFDTANYRAATIELRNVLQAEPENAEARLLMARSSWQLGDAPTAETHYARALGAGASGVDVWVGYGRAMLAQGKATEAFETVVPNLPEDTADEDMQAFLGDLYFSLGNVDSAEERYLQALAVNQSSPRGLVGTGMVAAVRGELDMAAESFRRATDLNADTALVWLARGNFERAQNQLDAAIVSYENALSAEDKDSTPPDKIAARGNLISALIDASRYDDASELLEKTRSEFPQLPQLEYQSGRLAFARNDYDKAREILQQYSGKFPEDPRAHAMLGIISFSRGNLRQAEFHLMQAVRGDAGNANMRRLLAETQLRLNEPDAALQLLESTEGSDSLSLAMLGRAQMAAGDADEAIRYFERSVEMDPQNSLVGLALATTYITAGRNESAVELLQSMPESADSELRRQTLLITALLRDGRVNEAVSEGERLLRENPDSADVRVAVGALRYSLQDQDGARQHFEDALQIEPTNIAALFSLSRLNQAAGDLPGAQKYLVDLLTAYPAHVPALMSLAAVLEAQDQLAEMPAYLRRAIEAAPHSVAPLTILARTELALGRPDAALAVVDGANQEFADAPEFSHVRGLVHLARNEPEQALLQLNQAVSADPRNAAFRFDLALAQLAGEQFTSAFDTGRAFIAMRPADLRGLSLVVNAAIRAGVPERARASVNAFAEANPNQRGVEGLRGDLELAAGNTDKAIGHFERAAAAGWSRSLALRLSNAYRVAGSEKTAEPLARWLNEHPDDAEIRLAYAQTLTAAGEGAAARAQYENLMERGELNAIGLNNLAWQYSEEGDPRAVELAEKAHAMAPDNPQIADTLGWILAREGETARAVELLRDAARKMPGNAEIAYHLASVLVDAGETDEARQILERLLASTAEFSSRSAAEQLAARL